MSQWYIEAGNQEGLPAYYSPKIARMLGADLGWSRDKSEALSFFSKEDAKEYVKKRMPGAMVRVVKVGT
jgi:hypothetical protein